MTSHRDGALALPIAEYLAAIELHGSELADAAESAGLDAAVPTCPGWKVRTLVQHTEAVFRHKTEAVRHPTTEGPAPRVEPAADSDVASYREALAVMLDVFRTSDLTAGSWTWCDHDHLADWWVRRMAHEAAIHGADAVVAAGETPRIATSLAMDGVDEILDEMLVGGPSWGTVTPTDERVDLVSGDREWRLRFGRFHGTSPRTGKVYDLDTLIHDESDEPKATISTDPGTLDLWLWGRAVLPHGSISGSEETAAKLRALAAGGTS